MRNLIVLTIIICLAFSLTACTGGTDEKETTKQDDSNKFPTFTSDTVTGETFSSDYFADYDLTIINIWATWCPPCVEEIEYLGDLYESMLPENVGMFSICTDGFTESKFAVTILSESGADYAAIIPSGDLSTFLTDNVASIPTTYFVDGDGNIVGNPIVGAPRSNVAETYLAEIMDRLE